MCLKHRFFIPILIFALFAHSLNAKSFLDTLRKLFSVEISKDIFDSINSDMIGSLRAENMRFFLPNRVEIDGVEVLDEKGQRVLYGKQVELYVSLLSLLTKNITITKAYVKEPIFNYSVANGIHNVVRVFESPKPSTSTKGDWRVSISHVRLENGSFQMHHDAEVSIFAQGIGAEGNFWIEDGPFGVDISKLTIDKGSIKAAKMDLPINNLVARKLWISDQKVTAAELVAAYQKGSIKASGTVFIENDRYDIAASIDAPEKTYPAGLPDLPFNMPSIRAKINMFGALSDPQFKVSADCGGTEYRGLPIKSGHINANINQHKVIISGSNFKIARAGQLFADGEVNIDKKIFFFNSKQKNIESAELANFLSLKELKTTGFINAETKINGELGGSTNSEFKVNTVGSYIDGQIENIKLSPSSSFNIQLSFIPDSLVKIQQAIVSDDRGLQASAYGNIDLNDNSFRLNYKLKADSAKKYISTIKDDFDIYKLISSGIIVQNNKGIISANGNLNSAKILYKEYRANNTKLEFNLNNDILVISKLKTEAYSGEILANFSIRELSRKKLLDGRFIANNIDLSSLSRPLNAIVVQGRASLTMDIKGTIDNPKIILFGEAYNLLLDKFEIKNTQFNAAYFNGEITVSEFNSLDKSGSLSGQNLKLNTKSKEISGNLRMADGMIAPLFSGYFEYADGSISGQIDINGTLDQPNITAELFAKNVTLFGQKLGSGPLFLSLRRDFLLGSATQRDLIISLASSLNQAKAKSDLRAAWAINNESLNFHGKLQEIAVDSSLLPNLGIKTGVKAKLLGNIEIQGKLDQLNIESDFAIPEFLLFDSERRSSAAGIKKNHGPAQLSASLKNGQFNLEFCARFADDQSQGTCLEKPGLSLALQGPFNFSSYDLELQGLVDHEHVEDLILPLKKELATLAAKVSVKAKISKKKEQQPKFAANIQLDKLSASTPTIPHIVLEQALKVALTQDSLKFEEPALLNFEPGQLKIAGSINSNKMDLDLNGTMPLMLARFFVPIIQRADGLALGQLSIKGDLKAPIFSGRVAPERGSLITFNRWLESMELRSGEIIFREQSNNGFVSELKNIKLALGDGKLALNGLINVDYATKDRPERTLFDLQMDGSNIVIKEGNQFVEADFSLRTNKTNAGAPTLTGNAVVTDGWISRHFDLRNFVAEAQGGTSGYPSGFLEEIPMDIDIDIGVRQFKASARMLNIDIDTIFSGQLRARGRIDHPKITGSLAIMEGKINFPATSFDLYESRIDLNEESDKIFDPIISLSSTQELTREEFPQLSRDTTIQLELKGNASRLMIELKPIRGDMKLSQTKIFLFLLMPASLSSKTEENQMDVIKRGAQNAAFALSGEVLRPLTNELQELLEGKTKTRIQLGSAFEPGGVSLRLTWKIGPRIEAQGSYMYTNDESRRLSAENSAFDVDNFPLGDLKLKLLLFDHRPLGPLSFESSFGANRLLGSNSFETRAALKLSYRVLSQ